MIHFHIFVANFNFNPNFKTQFSVENFLILIYVSGMTNIRNVGNAGDEENPSAKKESEGGRQTGAFSIEDILGGCRKDSGSRREFLPTLPPFLPLFHSLPPIFPFLPFAFNSDTRRPALPAQKKVEATFSPNVLLQSQLLRLEHPSAGRRRKHLRPNLRNRCCMIVL